jgi:predicted acetyltransferase
MKAATSASLCGPNIADGASGVAMLTQALIIARSLGVDRVLVTCNDDDAPSAAMIERCGGVLENKVLSIAGVVLVRRYWVD